MGPRDAGGAGALTLAVLEAAAEVIFLISGSNKAPALRRVLQGPRPDLLPAHMLASRSDGVRFLVDAEAAAELD